MLARLAPALLAAALAACISVEPPPAPIVVLSDLDNRPFAYVDLEGEPAGRDVEMMRVIAERLARRLDWRQVAFEELLPRLQRGEADVVCATLGITPERGAVVDFTQPYFRTAIAVVVRAGTDEPHELGDLEGRRVYAARGTTSQRALARNLPLAEPVTDRDKVPEELLRSGAVDALVMDGPAADALVARSGGALERLAQDVDTELYALALPQGSELRAAINRVLAEMESTGEMALLDRRWLGP